MYFFIYLFPPVSTILQPVHSQDLYYFNVKPEDQNVVEGTETRLYCDVSDRRHIVFQWTQNGKPVVNTTRKFQEDSNLRIMRVLRGLDEGPFQCIATNATTGFSMQSQEAKLNIQCEYEWVADLYETLCFICVCICILSYSNVLQMYIG